MKLLFLGNLANYYTKLCVALNELPGVEAHFLHNLQDPFLDPDWEYPSLSQRAPWVHNFPDLPSLLMWFCANQHRFDVIQASASFVSIPRYRKDLLYALLGADLLDLPFEKSLRGWLTRLNLKSSSQVLFTNINHVAKLEELGIHNAVFFGHPIDRNYYCPHPYLNTEADFHRHGLVILNASRLDWSLSSARQTLNGNNLLLEAFVRLLNKGLNLKLVVPLMGRDKDKAREFVSQNNLGEHVQLMDPQPKPALIELYNRAHVVSDRFLSGGFGFATLEAMACGKPVLVNVNTDWADHCYGNGNHPPVLNVGNVEQICAGIELVYNDPALMLEMGQKARAWVVEEHDMHGQATKLLKMYRDFGFPR